MTTLENLKIEKLQNPVINTDLEYVKESKIVAFQLVKITYNVFGSDYDDVFDTKIMKDGRQLIVDGDGFIKSGLQIN